MDPLSFQELFGYRVTGNIGMGNGSGYQAIGKGHQNPMQFGFPAIGNREEGVGSGSQDIGSTAKKEVTSFRSQVLGFITRSVK